MTYAIIMSFGRLLAMVTLWLNACIFVGLFLTWFAPALDIPVVLGQLSSDTKGTEVTGRKPPPRSNPRSSSPACSVREKRGV